MIERDPRDMAYAALYVAIVWHKEITPEEAYRMVYGKSKALPANRVTPEDLSRIQKRMESPNYRDLNTVEDKLRINRYEVMCGISGIKKEPGEGSSFT